jgi:hypothetical protein
VSVPASQAGRCAAAKLLSEAIDDDGTERLQCCEVGHLRVLLLKVKEPLMIRIRLKMPFELNAGGIMCC